VIASWFTPLLHLTSQVIFFDILWRILKSFRLFYKHWKGTIIRVPPVDLREHSLVDDLGGMCGSIFTTMMQFMSQLSLYVIFILVGLGLLLWTLSGLSSRLDSPLRICLTPPPLIFLPSSLSQSPISRCISLTKTLVSILQVIIKIFIMELSSHGTCMLLDTITPQSLERKKLPLISTITTVLAVILVFEIQTWHTKTCLRSRHNSKTPYEPIR
jgi:hypothetical protein